MNENISRSLEDVVGQKTYSVWVKMLSELVPDGRTHRLSVVVAGMLHYTLEVAINDRQKENFAANLLRNAWDTGWSEHTKDAIIELIDRLFRDANVSYERVSKRGEAYSIANEAFEEFLRWYDYPWD